MKRFDCKAAARKPRRRKHDREPDPPIIFPTGHLIAYTDGATFKANPGPISWAVVYVRDGLPMPHPDEYSIPWELVGAHREGTNNRAELMAVIWALEHEKTENLIIRTDSLVTLNCCLGNWEARANMDLWKLFKKTLEVRNQRGLVTAFEHVKGHHQDKFNKRADQLAGLHARHNFSLVEEP